MTDIANNNPTTDPISSCLTILGIDVGTSGIRGVIVRREAKMESLIAEAAVKMPFPKRENACSEQDASIWISTLETLLSELSESTDLNQITHIVTDATSSSVLLSNAEGIPLTKALMYDDKRAQNEAKRIATLAPAESGAHGASSTLAKVMWLEALTPNASEHAMICHQIDWINYYLCGQLGVTDENNALKLGFDSVNQCWPDWISKLLHLPLPRVIKPGEKLGKIQPGLVTKYGFSQETVICAGTTDSIAAFLASGAQRQGDAVVSLGSTLAIKLLSDQPVFAPQYGIYSHFVQGNWLVGGASNSGGAVLLHYFDLDSLIALLPQLQPEQATGLNYYPLIQAGERFPIADANLQPNLTPRPKSDSQFLQGLIEGLVKIEQLGFERLVELGAPAPSRIYTAGGGSQNAVWMQLRQNALPAEFCQADSKKAADAAFGVTRLITS